MLLRNVSAVVLASGLVLTVGCGGSNSTAGSTHPPATPAIYTETNATAGNAVLAYSGASNGSLTAIGTYSTGGSGVGLPTYKGRFLSQLVELLERSGSALTAIIFMQWTQAARMLRPFRLPLTIHSHSSVVTLLVELRLPASPSIAPELTSTY